MGASPCSDGIRGFAPMGRSYNTTATEFPKNE
jgi:hypothetical protein